MKYPANRSRALLNITVCICMAALPGTALAATNQYWNTGGTGGDGNWGTSPGDKNWNLVPGAAVGNTSWPDTIDDAANFQDSTGGTVTVFGDVRTTRITQNGADYTINAGNVALVRDSSAAVPVIEVATGTLTIDSVLAGTDGLRKMGPAELVLSGGNTYTGATSVESGTLTLTGGLASGSVRIDSAGTLDDVSGGLAPDTVLRNLGILTVSAPEIVATYLQESGATFSGTGPLTATGGSTLNGGTVAGTLLGDTEVTGDALVTGTLDGGTLSVRSGTLTLTGISENAVVDVASGSALFDENGGLSSAAALTSSGEIRLGIADTVNSFTMNGGLLSGPGTLTVATPAILNNGAITGGLSADAIINGPVVVSGSIGGGSLTVNGGGALTLQGVSENLAISVSAGGAMSVTNGGLNSAAAVINAGNLTFDQPDTIATYVQNVDGILTGAGALTATGGTILNGGTIAGTLLGNTEVMGNALVTGTLNGGTLSVRSGTLTLTGISENVVVDVASGSALFDENGGLSSAAALTSSGEIRLGIADMVNSFTMNGGLLSGPGTLTVATPAILNNGAISGSLSADAIVNGPVVVSGSIGGGSLTVNGGGALTLQGVSENLAISVSAGGSMSVTNSGLNSAAAVINAGNLTFDQPDTIATYTQNGDGILAGAGPLTATGGSTLNGGTVAGSLLGNSNITGNVLVSGNLGGGSLDVAGTGTLTLTGTYTGSSVSIALNGELVDTNSGLSDSAAVTNTGTLTVNAEDYISIYVQNTGGTLAGTGFLNVTGGATLAGGTVSGNLAADIIATGSVTISGNVTGSSLSVQGGMVVLSGQSTHVLIGIAENSSLSDFSGGLADHAEVTNSGWLDVYSDDTVRVYIQNGAGSRLGGDSTLTVTDAIVLNGGSVSGKLSGNAISTGAVVVSGEIGGGILAVNGGTFSLSGTSTHSLVEISTNARFDDLAAGLGPDAAIINHGILAVENSDDTVRTYLQDGSAVLSGAATLTATNGATLHGGSISGGLLGNTVSTGNVLVSGTIGGGNLAVTGGTLRLTGVSENLAISISDAGSMSVTNSGLNSAAAVINAGSLTFAQPDTIATYVQNGDGILAGAAALTATGDATLNSGTVSGGLLGNIVSTGNVLVSGTIGGGNLAVTGGTLALSGVSNNLDIQISPSASLLDSNGGFSALANIANSGRLALATPDEILTYISSGGLLEGAGKLSASTAALNDNSSVTGILEAGSITTQGAVFISGSAVSDNIRIGSGILTNTGLLGAASTHLDIASVATLVASGTQLYNLLTTFGSGPAKWRGNLKNFTTVAPGGGNAFGNLQVTGDFTNAPGGTLKMDVAAAGHDQLGVGGTAAFGGALAVNQAGPGQIAPFIPVQLVSAAAYTGNFASMKENLDGAVFFNPENGSITRLGLGSDSLFSGATRNQRSTWISLYDDVIDPGKRNISRAPSGYKITSGIADEGNPDLLRALAASFTPVGLDVNLLNHLSAEIYTSVLDYAMQATRQHQRTALSAPALAPRAEVPGYSSKSSAKDAIAPAPSFGRNWEFFAAADYFHAETDNSQNSADYKLSGAGFLLGARNQLTDRFQLAGYAAADTGSIDGSLIDSDQTGWSLGIIGETLLDEKSHTVLTTTLSYGSYESDGTRQSASATAAGWTPGKVHFDNIDSSALELYAGVDTTVYRDQRFRVIASAGLRYSSAYMDRFTESTGSAVGSPVALKVSRQSYNQWTLEMGVAAEARLSDQFTLQGRLGFNAGLGDDSHDIRSRFAKGSRPMSAEADGLTDDLFYLGLGLEYRVSSDVTVGLGYRSDFRPSHPVEQGVNISSAFRF